MLAADKGGTQINSELSSLGVQGWRLGSSVFCDRCSVLKNELSSSDVHYFTILFICVT